MSNCFWKHPPYFTETPQLHDKRPYPSGLHKSRIILWNIFRKCSNSHYRKKAIQGEYGCHPHIDIWILPWGGIFHQTSDGWTEIVLETHRINIILCKKKAPTSHHPKKLLSCYLSIMVYNTAGYQYESGKIATKRQIACVAAHQIIKMHAAFILKLKAGPVMIVYTVTVHRFVSFSHLKYPAEYRSTKEWLSRVLPAV